MDTASVPKSIICHHPNFERIPDFMCFLISSHRCNDAHAGGAAHWHVHGSEAACERATAAAAEATKAAELTLLASMDMQSGGGGGGRGKIEEKEEKQEEEQREWCHPGGMEGMLIR